MTKKKDHGAELIGANDTGHGDTLPRPSSLKHTPGPWLVDPLKIGTPWNVGTVDGESIGMASQWEGDPLAGQPKRTANAHLIAAAPDLLAVAKMVLDHCEDLPTPLVYAAAVAIQKAEGR